MEGFSEFTENESWLLGIFVKYHKESWISNESFLRNHWNHPKKHLCSDFHVLSWLSGWDARCYSRTAPNWQFQWTTQQCFFLVRLMKCFPKIPLCFTKKIFTWYLIVMLYGIATANHLNPMGFGSRFHAFILLRIDRVHLSAGISS